jgi:hypothetical protein
MAVEQYRGKVKARKALDEHFSGQTFISKDSSAKKEMFAWAFLILKSYLIAIWKF